MFEAGLTRGEGGLRRRCWSRPIKGGDYAFLNLESARRSICRDRGVTGRACPAGLDAFVYTERGVYRTGETVHVTALLRDEQGIAAVGVPLTHGGRAAGRRRVSPRRACRSGRRRPHR